jgi:propanol-preferring alcohol dehydrogenase
MEAWVIEHPGPVDSHPLRRVEKQIPTPGFGQVRLKVSVCGVCRTDLHLAEGDLEPKRTGVIPGHEAVGRVEEVGPGCTRLVMGDRIGVPWLARTCGICRFCTSRRENLCTDPLFTGWDVDGGYAPYAVVEESYAYRLPDVFTDEEAAPLLCAGIIGYRALRRSNLPAGGRLGIYGFGGSAHLAAQVAVAQGAAVHVITRSAEARELARALGVTSVGDGEARPPEPLDAAILFAPAGPVVLNALAALDRGGTLAIAGIYLSDIPALNYQDHLFEERAVQSVTANTRRDGEEFFEIAARIPLSISTTSYPMEEADEALADLAHGRVTGAAVLLNSDP